MREKLYHLGIIQPSCIEIPPAKAAGPPADKGTHVLLSRDMPLVMENRPVSVILLTQVQVDKGRKIQA